MVVDELNYTNVSFSYNTSVVKSTSVYGCHRIVRKFCWLQLIFSAVASTQFNAYTKYHIGTINVPVSNCGYYSITGGSVQLTGLLSKENGNNNIVMYLQQNIGAGVSIGGTMFFMTTNNPS